MYNPQDESQMMEQPMQDPAEAGRSTDNVLGHLSLGEIVIPRAFLDEPEVMQMLQALFEQNQTNINEFTVGHADNKINPETGYPEFFKWGKIAKIARIAAPIAASFIPGIGPIAAAAIGAAAGGIGRGGSLGGALLGGLGGYAGAGGLSGTAVGRGIDSLKAGIADTVVGRGISSAYGGVADAIGGLASPAVQGPLQPGAASLGGGAGSGSGFLGKVSDVTGLTKSITPLASSAAGSVAPAAGGGSSYLSTGANVLGGLAKDAALKKQQKELLAANQAQAANFETFDPSNITNDAGYQFNLQQGQEGLNKQLAAGGSLYSGRALKAASEYNQNYANNAFQSAYQRWLQKTQGQNALTGTAGDIRATRIGAGAENLSQSLSNAIGAPVGGYGQGLTLEQLRRLNLA